MTKQNLNEREYILVCSCFNQSKKAIEAFNIMFPFNAVPDIIKGRDRIYKLAQELGNEHIKAISKLSGKYSYYVKLDGDKIIEEVDLMRGKKIQ